MPTSRGSRAVIIGLVLALSLAACGDDDDDEPTAAPTAPAETTATAPAGTPVDGFDAALDASPGATPAASPDATPVAGEATVGDLADRIGSAWAGVTTYRVNEVTFAADGPAPPFPPVASPAASQGASPVASPDASPAAGPIAADQLVIDEVVLPDRKRRRIVEGGEVVSEIVVVDGQAYARGDFVRRYVDPTVPPETWVALDLSGVAPGTPLDPTLANLLAPIGAPLGGLPPEQRALPARPAGQTTVDGRTCDVYEVVRTTATGERVDVTIGLDTTGLPCLIETRAGGQVTLATYVAFNEPITIEPPAEFVTRAPLVAATPEASPEASPAAG